MPKTARDVPPPLELACLKALWSLEEGNVRAVQQIVALSRPLAYTTIWAVAIVVLCAPIAVRLYDRSIKK